MEIQLIRERRKLAITIQKIFSQKKQLKNKIGLTEKAIEENKRDVAEAVKFDDRGHFIRVLQKAINERGVIEERVNKLERLEKNPYFGRIDYQALNTKREESYYLGRFGFNFGNRQEVIDWRAPIASLYYNYLGPTKNVTFLVPAVGAGKARKLRGNLNLKRTLDIVNGSLSTIFDHNLREETDGLLQKRIEGKSGGILEDIVETIQIKQNQIIRADPNQICIVQGVAGCGKTSIAIHRITYLFYNYQSFINDKNTLLVASSPLILNYVASMLPEIGIHQINQLPYFKLLVLLLQENKVNLPYKVIQNQKTEPEEIRVKSSFKFIRLLDTFVELLKSEVEEGLPQLTKLGLHLANLALNQSLSDMVLSLKDRLKEMRTIARRSSRSDQHWTCQRECLNLEDQVQNITQLTVNKPPVDLYLNLLHDSELLQRLFPGKLSEKEKQIFLAKNRDNLDPLDLAAIYYLLSRIYGSKYPKKYTQIVIDEAQDLAILDFVVLATLLENGVGITILGDLNQAIDKPGAVQTWLGLKRLFRGKKIRVFELDTSYRNTAEIVMFAAGILKKSGILHHLPKPFTRSGNMPVIKQFVSQNALLSEVVKQVKKTTKISNKTIGIIECDQSKFTNLCQDLQSSFPGKKLTIVDSENFSDFSKEGIFVIPKELVKGLEFSTVFLIDPNSILFPATSMMAKYLYVLTTRAINNLYIYHLGDLSVLLGNN